MLRSSRPPGAVWMKIRSVFSLLSIGSYTYLDFCEMLSITFHMVRWYFDIIEHTLQFLSEMEAHLNFELGKHTSFSIVWYWTVSEKSFSEMSLVVSLKDVLVSNVTEDGNGFIQYGINFLVRFLRTKATWTSALITKYKTTCQALTPLRPFFRFSSINRDIYSGARLFRFMNVSKAY